jgi:O-antigen/teichoic acid export membrane protein
MLAPIRGATETGLYSASVRVAEFVGLLPGVVQAVFLPVLASLTRERRGSELKTATMTAMMLVLVPGNLAVVALVTAARPLAVGIFGREYAPSGKMIAILALAEIAVFVGTMLTSVALAVGARSFAGAAVAGLVVNVVGNLLFVRRYGGVAAAWASLAGYSVAALLTAANRDVLEASGLALRAAAKVTGVTLAAAGAATSLEVNVVLRLLFSCGGYVVVLAVVFPEYARRAQLAIARRLQRG